MWVNPQRTDHVKEGIRMNVFLMGMTTEDELEFGSCHKFSNNMEDIVADDTFCSGKKTDSDSDDPSFGVGENCFGLPLFDIPAHGDFFRFPMVIFHLTI